MMKRSDYIAHYGIKGQKWGVRRFQNKDGSLTSAGKQRRKSIESAKSTSAGRTLSKYTSPTREMLVSSILAQIPVIGDIRAANSAVQFSKMSFDKTNYAEKERPREKLSTLRKKTIATGTDDDLQKVNPFKGKRGGVMNCPFCTAAMEMRARGYDVQARRSADGRTRDVYSKWFEGAKVIQPYVERNPKETRKSYANRAFDNLTTTLEQFGNGARGYVGIVYEKSCSGHAMYWRVDNNTVTFYDGQSKKTKNDKLFALSDPSKYSFARLDNCKPTDEVCEAVMSREDRK